VNPGSWAIEFSSRYSLAIQARDKKNFRLQVGVLKKEKIRKLQFLAQGGQIFPELIYRDLPVSSAGERKLQLLKGGFDGTMIGCLLKRTDSDQGVSKINEWQLFLQKTVLSLPTINERSKK
jgi:hypothetical protein